MPATKPLHVYEGTDSEDDNTPEQSVAKAPESKKYGSKSLANPMKTQHVAPQTESRLTIAKEYTLKLGDLASEDDVFCPWRAVKDYPRNFIGNANRAKVVHSFYAGSQFLDERWDFFYLYSERTDLKQSVVLVPTAQVVKFLSTINKALGINLTIPNGGTNAGFRLKFNNDGTPRPRYLGPSTNSEMARNLHKNIPPSYYKPSGELNNHASPSASSKAAYKAKWELIMNLQKIRKAASAEKRKKDQIEKHQSWGRSIERVQRYLGLRQAQETQSSPVLPSPVLHLGEGNTPPRAVITKSVPSTSFDVNQVAPFEPEDEVVFVCVDIEAYEKNSRLITEVGVATLDTRDIKSVPPGKQGTNWMSKIRARHFRIIENAQLHNHEYVKGCADKFDFGSSEFIKLSDACGVVASCFKEPFSKTNATAEDLEEQPKRPIILLGHDTGADIAFMKQLGYNVHNLSNLLEIADTAIMWRYLKREPNNRSLGTILYELGIAGWHLHNAGNDAVFTLQAMIAIVVKHIVDEDKAQEDKGEERNARIPESTNEATGTVPGKEEGWSSSGNNSASGMPVISKPQDPLKNNKQANFRRPHIPNRSTKVSGSNSSSSSGSPQPRMPQHKGPRSGDTIHTQTNTLNSLQAGMASMSMENNKGKSNSKTKTSRLDDNKAW